MRLAVLICARSAQYLLQALQWFLTSLIAAIMVQVLTAVTQNMQMKCLSTVAINNSCKKKTFKNVKRRI